MEQPSNAVLHTLIQGIDRNISVVLSNLKEISEKTSKNSEEIVKLNKTIEDYPEYKKKVDDFSNWKAWLAGAMATLLVAGGLIWTLTIEKFESKIKVGIDNAFKERDVIMR